MVALRKHLNPATRREQIIAASDVILQQVGVNDFTIDKVVEYLGIAKGTVYKYFSSKDDVLAEVSAKALNQLLNYFKLSELNSPEGLDKTRSVIMSSYHYSIDCPKYFELIVYLERPEFETLSEAHKKVSTSLNNYFSNHIKEQQDKGFIRKEIDPLMANYMVWGSSMGVMQFLDSKKAFFENTEHIQQKKLMETFVEIIVQGMAA